jgi:acyl-coenzyme A thioesterase PaaI-like protein
MKKNVNRYGVDLLEIFLRNSVSKSYGKYASNTLTGIIYDKAPAEMSFKYKIPPALCRVVEKQGTAIEQPEGNKDKSIFSTAGIMSIMDELSTYSLALIDKGYRPGVSVDLYTETLRDAHANEEVIITTRADKIGKILAFCTMEMSSLVNGEVLARGKHIRYLPMGWWWDILAKPYFAPIVHYLYQNFRRKTIQTPIDHLFDNLVDSNQPNKLPPVPDCIYESGYYFKLLNINKCANADDRKAILEDLHDDHHENCDLYDLKVLKLEMTNPVGALHGGALGACIEVSCFDYKLQRMPQLRPKLRVKSLDIRYMAPMKVRK